MTVHGRHALFLRPWTYPEHEWTKWVEEPSPVDHLASKRNCKAFGTNIFGDYDIFRLILMTGRSLACHWWDYCRIVIGFVFS